MTAADLRAQIAANLLRKAGTTVESMSGGALRVTVQNDATRQEERFVIEVRDAN